jgi:DNA-binding transcriptional LysR family regulator
MRAAEAGMGVAMLPDFVFRERREDRHTCPHLEEFLPTDRGIYAIYPHRRYLPAKVRAFVDFLTQWFKSHNDIDFRGTGACRIYVHIGCD